MTTPREVSREWKDITGYKGYYQVSDDGLVRSLDRRVMRSDGRYTSKAGKLIYIRTHYLGYRRVKLSRDGKNKIYYVHRLVANAFLNCPSDDSHEINHLDGNKANNLASNLEWVTRSENILHATRVIKTLVRAKGEDSPRAKITNKDAVRIRRLYGTGEYSQRALAKMYDMSKTNIRDIVRGKTWTNV